MTTVTKTSDAEQRKTRGRPVKVDHETPLRLPPFGQPLTVNAWLRAFADAQLQEHERHSQAKKAARLAAGIDLAPLDEQYVYLEKSGSIYDLVNQEYVTRKSFSVRGPSERHWLSRSHDGKRPTASGLIVEPCAQKVRERLLPRPVLAASVARAVAKIHDGHDAGAVSAEFEAKSTPEVAKRPCEAVVWTGTAARLTEALKLPQDDFGGEGMPSPGQGLKREPRDHFVRRFFNRGLQFGFAVLTAFLLAQGLPVLDVISPGVQG